LLTDDAEAGGRQEVQGPQQTDHGLESMAHELLLPVAAVMGATEVPDASLGAELQFVHFCIGQL
jgi:hypothetical protein